MHNLGEGGIFSTVEWKTIKLLEIKQIFPTFLPISVAAFVLTDLANAPNFAIPPSPSGAVALHT